MVRDTKTLDKRIESTCDISMSLEEQRVRRRLRARYMVLAKASLPQSASTTRAYSNRVPKIQGRAGNTRQHTLAFSNRRLSCQSPNAFRPPIGHAGNGARLPHHHHASPPSQSTALHRLRP